MIQTLPTPRVSHPAKYSRGLLSLFAKHIQSGWRILDPFAGTGKLGRLKHFIPALTVVCNELEPEWATEPEVDEWHFGDAAQMAWATDASFDALVTSPVYGNRMSDTYTDHTKRLTYRAGLGHSLHPENTGQMQWGERYRVKHQAIYAECMRVLKPRGLFLLNVSDHIRAGQIMPVSQWHVKTLQALGLSIEAVHEIETPRARFGQNYAKRVRYEFVYVLQKP